MSRNVEMQTVSRTPIKKVFNTPNVSCRICDVNIKISGRFSCNIFQPNHRDFLKRFEVVLDDKVRDSWSFTSFVPEVLQNRSKIRKSFRTAQRDHPVS